jgi:hypothetical protein
MDGCWASPPADRVRRCAGATPSQPRWMELIRATVRGERRLTGRRRPKPCSQQWWRYGCGHRHRLCRVVSSEPAEPTPTRLDPLHAMQFRPPPPPQVTDLRPAQRPCPSDRDYPLHTAGDRCLWHVGGTDGQNDDSPTGRDGSRPAGGLGASSVTTGSWALSQGLAAGEAWQRRCPAGKRTC